MTENAELERYATDSDDPRTSSAGTGPGPSMNITWRGAGKPHKYRLVDRKQNVEMKGEVNFMHSSASHVAGFIIHVWSSSTKDTDDVG